jgi:imidazoleglycerol-phosphate dehydratase
MRVGQAKRSTTETTVAVTVNLDGSGRDDVSTGAGFLDHMLAQVARHGLLDLDIRADGDTQVDFHHTVEDVGICLGQALARALDQGAGIKRFGHAVAPMDEALVLVAIDICGRGFANVDVSLPTAKVGNFDTELVPEFLRALAVNAGITLHVRQLSGANSHHVAEAIFKGVGLALREAVALDARQPGVPSTKGSLL